MVLSGNEAVSSLTVDSWIRSELPYSPAASSFLLEPKTSAALQAEQFRPWDDVDAEVVAAGIADYSSKAAQSSLAFVFVKQALPLRLSLHARTAEVHHKWYGSFLNKPNLSDQFHPLDMLVKKITTF